MSDEILHRTFAAELAADGRTVDCRIVPYGERITHNDGLGGRPEGEPYEEEWVAGAFTHQLGPRTASRPTSSTSRGSTASSATAWRCARSPTACTARSRSTRTAAARSRSS